jgi:hypothetical protein
MLRNHGLLTVGATAADAFVAMYFFEASCMIQVRAQAGGEKLTSIPLPILSGIKEQLGLVTRGVTLGALAWPGLLRRLDRRNPDTRIDAVHSRLALRTMTGAERTA